MNKKFRKKNLKASSENISSKLNTNTISDSIENIDNVMKNSSTHELISDLPDLNDGEKHNANNKESNVNDIQNNKVSMACVADKKVIKINLHCFLKTSA